MSRPASQPQPGRPAPDRQTRPMSSATPAAAGLAVVLAATALSGVVDGTRWLVFVAVATAAVVGTGVLLRSITLRGDRQLPVVVVAAGEVAALACLLTAVFTRSGLVVLLPTPTALRELRSGLSGAMLQVESGVPPVEATTEMLLLITLGLGLVAVAVDIIAVSFRAPAATGLLLLCVFAVPASVSDGMLPWWTFVLGAGGFALLLVVDGQRRHLAWRGTTSAPSSLSDHSAGPTAAAVAGAALVLALVAGSTVTLIGTIGRLPGGGGGASSGTIGVGLKPFTSLRGQLKREGQLELFRVRGLDRPAYLRALTLRKYSPGEGWVPDGIAGGVPVSENLPPQPGQSRDEQTAIIEIEALHFRDTWLPVYGIPVGLNGVPRGYRYDPQAGTVFADRPYRPSRYTERALFPDLLAEQLRSAVGPDNVDPEYLQLDGVDKSVYDLASKVTDGKSSRFDKVIAINRYFTEEGRFTYSEQTAKGGSQDALLDFLTVGKTGYCEQFASSMAVMLRALGIPSRVAIGFTAGYPSGDAQVITTNDAHAWVEVFFPGIGWTTFDPTPLADGRSITPPYVARNSPEDGLSPDDQPNASASPTTGAPTTAPDREQETGAAAATTGDSGGDWLRPLTVTVLVLVLLAGVVTGPASIRVLRRRAHLRAVAAGGPGAATAAWRELLAESWDRGMAVQNTDTVRIAAGKIARQHGLDDGGRHGLRAVVGAVERSWYGAGNRTEPGLDVALREVLNSFARSAPLALRSRLLPRSVLRPRQ